MEHQNHNGRRRAWWAVVGLLMLCLPVPAYAQKMSEDGGTLPAFFFSRSEQTARRACLNDLPECRDSVRQRIAVEKISFLIAPWVLTAFVIWGAIIYVRRRDAKRDERTRQLQRNRVRPDAKRASQGQRRGQEIEEAADKKAAEDDDDDIGRGHPGDSRR